LLDGAAARAQHASPVLTCQSSAAANPLNTPKGEAVTGSGAALGNAVTLANNFVLKGGHYLYRNGKVSYSRQRFVHYQPPVCSSAPLETRGGKIPKKKETT